MKFGLFLKPRLRLTQCIIIFFLVVSAVSPFVHAAKDGCETLYNSIKKSRAKSEDLPPAFWGRADTRAPTVPTKEISVPDVPNKPVQVRYREKLPNGSFADRIIVGKLVKGTRDEKGAVESIQVQGYVQTEINGRIETVSHNVLRVVPKRDIQSFREIYRGTQKQTIQEALEQLYETRGTKYAATGIIRYRDANGKLLKLDGKIIGVARNGDEITSIAFEGLNQSGGKSRFTVLDLNVARIEEIETKVHSEWYDSVDPAMGSGNSTSSWAANSFTPPRVRTSTITEITAPPLPQELRDMAVDGVRLRAPTERFPESPVFARGTSPNPDTESSSVIARGQKEDISEITDDMIVEQGPIIRRPPPAPASKLRKSVDDESEVTDDMIISDDETPVTADVTPYSVRAKRSAEERAAQRMQNTPRIIAGERPRLVTNGLTSNNALSEPVPQPKVTKAQAEAYLDSLPDVPSELPKKPAAQPRPRAKLPEPFRHRRIRAKSQTPAPVDEIKEVPNNSTKADDTVRAEDSNSGDGGGGSGSKPKPTPQANKTETVAEIDKKKGALAQTERERSIAEEAAKHAEDLRKAQERSAADWRDPLEVYKNTLDDPKRRSAKVITQEPKGADKVPKDVWNAGDEAIRSIFKSDADNFIKNGISPRSPKAAEVDLQRYFQKLLDVPSDDKYLMAELKNISLNKIKSTGDADYYSLYLPHPLSIRMRGLDHPHLVRIAKPVKTIGGKKLARKNSRRVAAAIAIRDAITHRMAVERNIPMVKAHHPSWLLERGISFQPVPEGARFNDVFADSTKYKFSEDIGKEALESVAKLQKAKEALDRDIDLILRDRFDGISIRDGHRTIDQNLRFVELAEADVRRMENQGQNPRDQYIYPAKKKVQGPNGFEKEVDVYIQVTYDDTAI